ncbi:Cleavage inducible protein [Phytophthora megakarya]|uniref:Cleavage inducible protein n=1 Tax=Phytophthora megakarya TaxID=4795 RepID=A0A225W472_9STRA|nr:Cleavage inducible protein [Phytophthora megakarya]
MYIDEATAQRRFVSAFIKGYSALHSPHQHIPTEIIPDTFDEVTKRDVHNFLIADITNNKNHVYCYDECAQVFGCTIT